MELVFAAVQEQAPGARWQALFRAKWPAYKAWYLAEGIAADLSPVPDRAAPPYA